MDFIFSHNLSVLIQLYKHEYLIPTINHEHSTRYKININIDLPHVNKVFGQNSVFHAGLCLCRSLNINIDYFKSFELFKMYEKNHDQSKL